MFKKLRIKFIAITMAMVAIVMALAFTAVCIIEYQRSYSVVQTALDNSVQRAVEESLVKRDRDGGPFGVLPEELRGAQAGSRQPPPAAQGDAEGKAARPPSATSGEPGDSQSLEGEPLEGDSLEGDSLEGDSLEGDSLAEKSSDNRGQSGASSAGEEDAGQSEPPRIGNRPGQQRTSSSIVPVAAYRVESDGTFKVIPSITTASISSDVLQEATDYVMQANEGFGTLANLELHYLKAHRDGKMFISFADTSYTDGWKSLALMLVGVGLATLVVFFVISLFYSRWALAPVREAWDSQKQFVADASHDLKTPLTVILANASILLKHPDHTIASESQWVESTQKEAEEMQGLVNEMLELAHVEAQERIESVRDAIDLSDLVDGETLLFDSVALERGYQFECSIDVGVRILGDEKQVKKMVSTLVENAFKYVNEGGTVAVTLRKTGKTAVLTIRNTGSTISEADLPHIFDRFYRTDKARTSGAGGFGLGLAIACGIAQQHGGDITCASSETEGTAFTVKLPLSDN